MSEPAPAPASDRLVQIVDAARDLLEREGPDGLTMRRLAERLGMRAPSLYKHVVDKEELEVLLIARALGDQGAEMHASVAELPRRGSRRVALAALAAAYRTWALAHPHLYRLATEGPLPREGLPEGLEAWAAQPIVRVAGTEARARAAWAFAHGMTILELDGRFPPGADLEAAWESGVASLA
ncbi:MAG: TetR/AcrR family transcriptional regulator [Actinomycetota bacterium]